MPESNKLFVVLDNSVSVVDRLSRSHRAFNEAWVRDLIMRAPELLPVSQVAPDAGEFLPIGMEVPLGHAGVADVIGVTTGGYPVVIETKLWRNPQARREVLAQAIDYIKEIARHDYEWLERIWNERRPRADLRTLAQAAAVLDEVDEAWFIDRVSAACRTGDILGFIVGDGIQHGLTELVNYLGRESAHLRYSLAMLELRCFEIDPGQLAVLPTILQEVVPVERAYVRIEPAAALADQLALASVAAEPEQKKKEHRFTLTEDRFWTNLQSAIGASTAQHMRSWVNGLQASLGLDLDYKQRALMLKVPDPSEENPGASILGLTSDGMIYNSMHAIKQVNRWGMDEEAAHAIIRECHARLQAIFPGFAIGGLSHVSPRQFVPIRAIADQLDEIGHAVEWVTNELRAEMAGERCLRARLADRQSH